MDKRSLSTNLGLGKDEIMNTLLFVALALVSCLYSGAGKLRHNAMDAAAGLCGLL